MGRRRWRRLGLPAMDAVAAQGLVGRAVNVPSHLPAGSDVATMSLLGYDPTANFTGRAPLEAAAQGIALGPRDWAIRCNLVTIEDQLMRDFTAGHISTAEARQLLHDVQQAVGERSLGISRRSQLPESAPVPRRRAYRAVQRGNAHDTAARLDGQERRGRFSPRDPAAICSMTS